ncbi:PREDICTED: uncharacterized protein LOC108777551, partial [Cyphomyrmex costatus]|uniref:uncharacterized protein LOC108777551 n=1 Tax=Cyphomyrmex costatus TaxID=456900 RepID=UPI00085222C4
MATAAVSQGQDKENCAEPTSVITSQAALALHASSRRDDNPTILSTAIVYVHDNHGRQVECCALLDCGSQANFVSRGFVTKLGLKPRSTNVIISGVDGATTNSNQSVRLRIQSRLNSYSTDIECIMTEQVTSELPAFTFDRSIFDIPRNLELADPQFYESSKVDLLLGVDIFWDLLCVGQVQASPKHPTLQKTRLGWILAGRIGFSRGDPKKVRSFHATITNAQIHDQLSLFWRQKDCVEHPTGYTLVETQCEQHFLNNVSQNQDGRFVVKLPIKEHIISELGSSRDIALKRLRNIEKRFERDPSLKLQYTEFMNEYLVSGHMRVADEQLEEGFYLPHHCVFKGSDRSSKIRVVFDASCKGSKGTSLNDALTVGPVVQQDLMSILLRFRTHRYAILADIIKMYRQILVDPSQTRFQRILWRDNASTDVQTYELTTVMYGTSSASYLATRCLTYLAELHESTYPVGSKCVKQDFYMDDMLTGADTIADAEVIIQEVTQLLRLGRFELSKWASNCSQLLTNVDGQKSSSTIISSGAHPRVLGVLWNQAEDKLGFSYEADVNHHTVSKRSVLSDSARLFDPLGILGPVVVTARFILQELWQAGCAWDESVPQAIQSRWLRFKSQLPGLNDFQIPRCVKFASNHRLVQVHGFCDASQRAYGAYIYIRTEGIDEYRLELLCSKSRIASLKAISLPRLELSAALLLAQLLEKVRNALDLSRNAIFLWSDSTIALNWLTSPSRKWSTFVANRVGEIQRLTKPECWAHISSADNPADVLSRGADPYELINSSLWWQGPTFLRSPQDQWPSGKFTQLKDDIPEARVTSTVAVSFELSVVDDLADRVSSLNKLCRILAYCFRIRKTHRPSPPTSFVSHNEISHALNTACRVVQRTSFSEEYKALSKGKPISTSSKLLSLSPFMDEIGLIRVGGRLRNSNLLEARHPILLPREHNFTKRVISHEHVRNMHAGAQATMAAIRQRFWPLSFRSSTRKILRSCITCFRVKPIQSEAIMGSLPASRVTMSRPFSHCGVDYAGPIIIKEGKRRNARNSKAYISIFVCFATKAVHIELVSDLTSDAFLGALRRFISRRDKPICMYSDNGSTFIGAHNQIKEIRDFLNSQQVQADVKQFLCEQETTWSFIPPNAPHFGGLWEAAVKSAKYHMSRIVGRANLTFEELQTVLAEIEAILNSRPLTQISSDPNDLSCLTPGHFLVGTAMNSLPCRDLSDVNENRLMRWQRVDQIRQHFWKRWSTEYLHSLQERHKWKTNKGTQLKPGQLVLIKQQGLAPMQWLLGRVLETHAGSDGNPPHSNAGSHSSARAYPRALHASLPDRVLHPPRGQGHPTRIVDDEQINITVDGKLESALEARFKGLRRHLVTTYIENRLSSLFPTAPAEHRQVASTHKYRVFFVDRMPDENIAVLKKQRTVIKSSCTRTKTYVDSITVLTPSVIAQLEERKLKLDSNWSDYNTVQARLEALDDAEANDRPGFEEAYFALSANIREKLAFSVEATRSSAPSPAPSSASNGHDSNAHVRLPKLNLPTFSGKYDEWFPFFDTFNAIIHSNTSISNVQKFQYLRSSLSSEASDVISSLEISDVNYEVAWRLLKERYDNKRIIVHTHIKAIMELPSMVKENSSELRQITDGACKHMRALQALQRPTSHWDDILIFILSAKLDTTTLREWQSSLEGTELPTLKQFIEFMTHRCQMLEATSRSLAVSAK